MCLVWMGLSDLLVEMQGRNGGRRERRGSKIGSRRGEEERERGGKETDTQHCIASGYMMDGVESSRNGCTTL